MGKPRPARHAKLGQIDVVAGVNTFIEDGRELVKQAKGLK
jgi:hypothetical protein